MFWKLHFGGNFLNRLPKRLVILVHNFIRLSVCVTLIYSYKETSQVTFIDFHNRGNCINIQLKSIAIQYDTDFWEKWAQSYEWLSSRSILTNEDLWTVFPHERHYIFSGNHDIICFHLPENFSRLFQPLFPVFTVCVSWWENVKCIKCQNAKVNVCSVIKDSQLFVAFHSHCCKCASLYLFFLP